MEHKQEEDDATFSFDSLPSFFSEFSSGAGDEHKYESLLADLRAHDLLGPSDADTSADTTGSSLFFNDAFTSAFMGSFKTPQPSNEPSKPAPPGFQSAPPGLAPSESDLAWSRGPRQKSRLESRFNMQTNDDDGEAVDESQVPGLRGLNLDDDEPTQPAPPASSPSPPVPSSPRPRPPPPSASPPPPPPSATPPPSPMQPPPPNVRPPMPMHMMRGPPPGGRGPPPGGRDPGGRGPQYPPHMPPPRRFKMMSERDISFVMQQRVKQLRTSDPFSDDYYFHNFTQKQMRTDAAIGRGLPLPSWKLEHVRSFNKTDKQRDQAAREWESQFQVLGRNTRTSLYRPKQALLLSNPTESEESNDAQDVASVLRMDSSAEVNSVFANDSWRLRLQVDRGLQRLLSLQEARHLLDARGVNVQQFHAMDEEQMDTALKELRHRTTTLLMELSALLGVSASETGETKHMQCDIPQLHRVLSVSKGRHLVSRALPLLPPSARFTLLPRVLEYLISPRCCGREVSDGLSKLSQTVVLLLRYHPPTPPADVLAEALELSMLEQDLDTLNMVLHDREKAEALQALLQCGATAVQESTEDVRRRWDGSQAQFVHLAMTIKQTA